MRAALEVLPKPFTADSIPVMRKLRERSRLSDQAIERDGAFTVARHTTDPGPDGATTTLLVCRPAAAATPLPVPVIYLVHGGGMTSGDERSGELAAELDRAQAVGAAVVSVAYRLAPEHPHPAPLQDCDHGLTSLVGHAEELGLDPARIVLSGTSAGAALAAGTCLLRRDRNDPMPIGQMLQSPMLDDRCDTRSAIDLDGTGTWDRSASLVGWSALLGDRRGADDVSSHAAPARATDLRGLPSALIDVGAADGLRDEAIAYAHALWDAGGEAELHVWRGGFHGFDAMVPEARVSRAANAVRLDWLRRLLA